MKVQVLEEFYIPGQPKVQRGVEMEIPYETANTLISRGLVKQLGKDTKKEDKQSETPKSDEPKASVVEDVKDIEDIEKKDNKKDNKSKK